jgi:mannan endo-1,4-beta-mannosidase
MKAVGIVISAALAVAAGVALVFVYQARPGHHLPAFDANSEPNAPATCIPLDTHRHYVGVVVYRPWQVTLPQFEQQSGIQPKIIEYYVEFGASLDIDHVGVLYHTAVPIIQLDPYSVPLAAIADGRFDRYLKSQATAVASFKCPIAVSFGHEMNGNWYPWGATHVKPATFIAAWRHIWTVFEQAGARNVIWTWTINRSSTYVSSIKEWWPGQKYVDWVGIDGYYWEPGNNFTYVFQHTIQQVHSLTRDPILITETSVTRQSLQGANIKNLFQGARKAGVFGVIWFNVNAKEPWNLAGRPPSALADFKEAAEGFEASR